MPKELTHWYLAKKVADEILFPTEKQDSRLYPASSYQTPSYPTLSRCVQAAPHTFLLGAVGPDFLFYYLKGPDREAFREAALVLHGRDGGNTLRPFVSVAEAYGGRFGLGVGAFLLGYLVHVVGDAVFHPLVLYSVGKGQGRPQYEHHVLESALDLYVLKRWGNEEGALPLLQTPLPGSIARSLPSLGATLSEPVTLKALTAGMTESDELSREEFLRLLGVVSFLGKSYPEKSLRTCLQRYEILQQWFWSPGACLVTRLLKILRRNLAFLEASCYQRRFYRYSEAFTGPLEYLHPVTGEAREVTVEDLARETVERFLAYAPQVEELFQKTVVREMKEDAGKNKNADTAAVPLSGTAGGSGMKAARFAMPVEASHPEKAITPMNTPDSVNVPTSRTAGGSTPGKARQGDISYGEAVQDEILGGTVAQGFRSLQGPNLETGIVGDRADRILYTRAEGLEGLFGPFGYRYR